MNFRRTFRLFALCLVTASLGACHFHGGYGRHCGGWGVAWHVPHCHSHCR